MNHQPFTAHYFSRTTSPSRNLFFSCAGWLQQNSFDLWLCSTQLWFCPFLNCQADVKFIHSASPPVQFSRTPTSKKQSQAVQLHPQILHLRLFKTQNQISNSLGLQRFCLKTEPHTFRLTWPSEHLL